MALAMAGWAATAAEPRPVEGNVESVILYRGQALVTRAVPVAEPAGRVELVVTGLPERVQPDSLFAEGSAAVEVRAVRFRGRAVGEAPREEVRRLDQAIEAKNDEMARNQKMQELAAQCGAYLDKLGTFAAATASADLSRGVLNAETLQKLTLFTFEQRKGLADEALRLATEARKLQEEMTLLQRRRAELAGGASRTVREAVLFLEKKEAAAAAVKLSYLVNAAGWSPSYNLRAGGDGKDIRLEYNALIQQTSGEDWSNVALTLSTASPALSAARPNLAPFRLGLTSTAAAQPAAQQKDVSVEKYQMMQRRMRKSEMAVQNAYTFGENVKFNWDMNEAATHVQMLEFMGAADQWRSLRRERAAEEDGPSVSYQLPGPVSLASRADQQMIRIADLKLAGNVYHVATPLLTSYVYREAEMTNTGMEVLLSGPASVYLDGRFVGRAEVPTVARGQGFVVGLGADSQLRARRELADKTENVRGGNQEVTVKYRLVIENFKDAPAAVRLMDRMPVPDRSVDVRVTLGEMKEKLSADKVYLQVERPKGMLRWDVQVPARAAGENAFALEYEYKLEFDRTLRLAMPAGEQASEMLKEFEELQKARATH